MKNKIEDLRNHLFAALEALADHDKPMELDRARAIADVARVIVDSAKAEVQFLSVTGRRDGTGFITLPEPEQSLEARRLSAVSGGRHRA